MIAVAFARCTLIGRRIRRLVVRAAIRMAIGRMIVMACILILAACACHNGYQKYCNSCQHHFVLLHLYIPHFLLQS
ncbi:hypothetical protein D3C85_1791330 [compost metagenome]